MLVLRNTTVINAAGIIQLWINRGSDLSGNAPSLRVFIRAAMYINDFTAWKEFALSQSAPSATGLTAEQLDSQWAGSDSIIRVGNSKVSTTTSSEVDNE